MTNTLTRDLKVISWNAQSLFPKSHEVIDFFESNVYDVICFSETWLQYFHKLYFPSYKLYRIDRQTGDGGGVAIAVNKRVKHAQMPSFGTKSIESVVVSIDTPSGPIIFVSVYFPGTDLSAQNIASFKSNIRILTSISNSYFVCGDLNAKHRLWNNLKGNSAGNIIFDEMNHRPFMVQNSPSPTYFPPQAKRNPSNIDIVLTNLLNSNTQVVPNHDLMSDHCAVEFTVNCSIERTSHSVKHFRFDLADWNVFKAILDSMNQSIPKRSSKVGYLKLTPEIKSKITDSKIFSRFVSI